MRMRTFRNSLLGLCGIGLGAVAAAQTANFTFLPPGPTTAATVDFTPLTTAQCDWDFGDGTQAHDTVCTAHSVNYASTGIFTVTLTVQPSGSSLTKDVGVLGGTQIFPTPAFTPSNFFPLPNETVTFTDMTTPPNSVGHWTWDFKDGTSSYIHNPSHSWAVAGDYLVSLTVENQATGEPPPPQATTTQLIHVSVPVTNTPTPTLTLTPTVTFTESQTPTITLTPTITQTLPPGTTLTPTPTATASNTPTMTSTAVPGTTVTTTQTVTPTPTGSASPGATATRTETPLKTRTPTISPNPDQTLAGYLGVVGSTPGNFDTFFKTAVQLTNPSSSAISGIFRYYPAGIGSSPTDLAWSLAPRGTLSYANIVDAMGKSGLGSMNISVGDGEAMPIVVTRIYNDGGLQGTSGFTEPFIPPSAVPDGGSGILIGPADTQLFRYNIGVRTLDSPVSLTATVRDANGAVVRVVHRNYTQPNFFIQTSSTDFLEGFALTNNSSIEMTFTGGGLIVYGATVDNTTQDPSAQFMTYGAGIGSAQRIDRPPGHRTSPLLLAVLVAILGLGFGGVIARR